MQCEYGSRRQDRSYMRNVEYQSRGDQLTEENINVQGAMGRSGRRVDPKEEWGVATVNAAEQSVGRL